MLSKYSWNRVGQYTPGFMMKRFSKIGEWVQEIQLTAVSLFSKSLKGENFSVLPPNHKFVGIQIIMLVRLV